MRCGRCGNENSEGNRFCGMCGASLVPKTETANRTAASSADKRPESTSGEARHPTRYAGEADSVPAAPQASRLSTPDARVSAQSSRPLAPPAPAPSISIPPISTPPGNGGPVNGDPVISGPSFLGLNKPIGGRSAKAYSSRGYDSTASGNLDYLLDDDEEEPKRGGGKLLLVVIALALIGGFGYLRWKQGGFDFLKPARVAAPAQNAPESGSTTAAPTPTPEAAAPNPAPANPAATPTSAAPNGVNTSAPSSSAPSSTLANPNPPTAETGSGGASAPAPGGAAGSGTETSTQQEPAANSVPAQSAPADNTGTANPQDNASGDKSTESDSAEDAEAAPAKPETHVQPAEAKPSAARTLRTRKPPLATPVDPTAEAEQYIYGNGVAQDCDRGLRLLKPAAAQSNAKAMILLGSLYSSGTCTPRDLPTAYRWFALALHKEPDNQRLQDDLQKLWSQMTQPERQLAIKLSQ